MPRKKSKSISGPKALIPVRALDFAMYNTKDIRKTRGFTKNSSDSNAVKSGTIGGPNLQPSH